MRLALPVFLLVLLAAAAGACSDESGGPTVTPSAQPATGTPEERKTTPTAFATASEPASPPATTASEAATTPPAGGSTDAAATAIPTPPATPATTATPTPSPTPAGTAPRSLGDDGVVTLADNRHSVQIRVGQTFLVQLGAELNWTVEVADQSIVSRVPGIAVIRGAQGVYRANRAGTTELTAVGDPLCRSATPPCAAPSRLFEVTVVVKP